MTSRTLTVLLATALAGLAVSAGGAHAEAPTGGTAGTGGHDCTNLNDGDVQIVRRSWERSTYTCTDGILCVTHGYKNLKGSWDWSYECHGSTPFQSRTTTAPGQAVAAPPVPTAVAAQ